VRSWLSNLTFGWTVTVVALAPAMPTTPQAAPEQSERLMLSTAEAQTQTGKVATVCGKVVDHGFVVAGAGIETLLYLDRPSSEAFFAIRILGGRRQAFRPPPEKHYTNQDTCVTGTIGTKEGVTQVEVEVPEQIAARHPQAGPQPKDGSFGHADALRRLLSQRDVILPRVVHEVKPKYTRAAMEARLEGLIEVEAVVLTDGTVGAVVVTRSLDPLLGLDDEAIRAVKQWVFQPGSRSGKPIDVLVTIELTFALKSTR
jgi:TonB family protein